MEWRLRLPGALYRHAVARAGSDADLAAMVTRWLTRYTADTPPGAAGGAARSAALPPDRRAAIARAAATARWAKPR